MDKLKKKSYILTFISLFTFYLVLMLLINFNLISRYHNSIIILILINIILACSLNITVGCLGQITLGHAGFMSIGAYSAALLSKTAIFSGVSGYIIALIVGGIVAGICGIIIGLPILRLSGDYLAIVTLAFGEIIRTFIEYFKFTGGSQGLLGIPIFNKTSIIYWITVVAVILMYSVMTGRHGRAILAIREDEIASASSGINTTFYKTLAFSMSAFFAGVAGGVYAHNLGLLGASQFNYTYSVSILVIVILGGMGSFTGAIISAIVLTVIPELLHQFSDYRMIIYSLLLIIVMIYRPSGLLGRKEFHISKLIKILEGKWGR